MANLRLVSYLFFASLAIGRSCDSSPTSPPSFHGTVNILLANKNGLVAITDSRLSSDGRPPASGQKLFQLDDKTICTIAGAYLVNGPSNPQGGVLGFALVCRSIDQITHDPYWSQLSSVSDKSKALTNGLALAFQSFVIMAQTQARMYGVLAHNDLQVSVAGFDATGLHVIQNKLALDGATGLYGSSQLARPPVTIGGSFEPFLAGIKNFTEPILENPDQPLLGLSEADSQAIEIYAKARRADGGASLTLDQMKGLGVAMEKYSEVRDPRLIGGEVESATLSAGTVTLDVPASVNKAGALPLPNEARVHLHLLVDVGFSHLTWAIAVPPGALAILVGGSISDAGQQLDRTSFSGITFTNVTFTYAGSGIALFDPGNRVINSTLKLAPGVSPDDPIVRYMLTTFPDLHLKAGQ